MPSTAPNGQPHYDVAVVGAGTTGLILSQLLAMQGVRVALIDPNKIVCQHPRGSHIDDECMRIIQALGLGEQEKDYSRHAGFEVYAPDGRQLIAWDMVEGETEQGWLSDYQFFQPDFESILRGKLAMSEAARLLIGWEVTSLSQDDELAHVTIHNRRSGRTEDLTASYVVGCDGARSLVRESVLQEMEDFDGTKQSLIIDVYKYVTLDSLPAQSTYMRSGPRPMTHQPTHPPISRFNFMLIGDEDLDSFENPEAIYELLRPWLQPDTYRIMRSDVYEWHSRLAVGWRAGRLLIAGDAAHLMPPALGQGMCSGMRDAANLAWKLASVVSGVSDPALLDTYESERSPHVRQMILESTWQSELIAAVGKGQVQTTIDEARVVNRAHEPIGPGFSAPGLPLGGSLAPQPRVASGDRMDDLVGYRFAVIGSAAVIEAVPESTRRAWTDLGAVVIMDAGPEVRAWLDRQAVDAVILRPDRYVFAAAAGVEQLVDATSTLQRQLLRRELIS